jgi:hypothetical protein
MVNGFGSGAGTTRGIGDERLLVRKMRYKTPSQHNALRNNNLMLVSCMMRYKIPCSCNPLF